MTETRTNEEVLNDLEACLRYRCIDCSYSGRKNKRCINDLMAEIKDKIMEDMYGGKDGED